MSDQIVWWGWFALGLAPWLLLLALLPRSRRAFYDHGAPLPPGYLVQVRGGLVLLLEPGDDQWGSTHETWSDAVDAAWSLHGRELAAEARRTAERRHPERGVSA